MSAITAGNWEASGQYVRTPLEANGGGWLIADCRDSSLPWEECYANARLIAEAGTVANETGLSPRQLADQRAELLEALEDLDLLWTESQAQGVDFSAAITKARAALAKASEVKA